MPGVPRPVGALGTVLDPGGEPRSFGRRLRSRRSNLRQRLRAPASLTERIDDQAFDGTQLSRRGTWVVAFLAGWCPFCRAFEPELARLASRDGLSVLVADLTDEDGPLWDRFRIRVVPTVIVFRDGRPGLRRDGRSGYGLDARDLAAIRTFALGGPPARPRPPGP